MYQQETFLPLSYLNHLIYCPRRFWYMYVLGEVAVNAPMLEGSYQHQKRADRPGHETDENGRTTHRRLWVWSKRLNIAGFADFVEVKDHQFIPVERKHGQKGKWDNDNIQLCAQAFCLEEMTGAQIPYGEIFYWRSRQRITVPFDETVRQATRDAVTHANAFLQSRHIPDPIAERQKCHRCSIQPICLPDEVGKLRGKKQEVRGKK